MPRSDFDTEFAGEFAEVENAYVKMALAGGVICEKIATNAKSYIENKG